MQYIFNHKTSIERKLKSAKLALLLDFDLTLSPLAKNPNHAFLPKATREILKKIARIMPTAVISGRKLSDVKKRVGIKNLTYIGNHGLEHNLNKNGVSILSPKSKNALNEAKKKLTEKCRKYPGVIFEKKKYSFAMGFRLVKGREVRPLVDFLRKFQKEAERGGLLKVQLDKKTFEILPAAQNANKGTASLLVLETLRKKYRRKFLPIYIGDGQTDEDAFKVLKRRGVTIRVGKSKKSAATWYLRDQREVNRFLKWLLSWFS